MVCILGLSDLGKKRDPSSGVYSGERYQEAHDNYIAIILLEQSAER